MNSFMTRLQIILVAAVLLILVTGFLVVPTRVSDFALFLDEQPDNVRLGMAVVAVFFDLLLGMVIYRQTQALRHRNQGLMVRSRDAQAQISLDSLQRTLDRQLTNLKSVREVLSNVRDEQGRVAVSLSADVEETADIRKVTKQLNREIQKLIQHQMGLKLADKPQIRFHMGGRPLESDTTPSQANPSVQELGETGVLSTPSMPSSPSTPPLTTEEADEGAVDTILLRPDEDEDPVLLKSSQQ